MTWSADLARCRLLVAVCLLLVAAGVVRSETNEAPVTAMTAGLPAWMEADVLATNLPAWADLADLWRRNPDANASPVENLELPVEHYDNGRIRAVLYADRAAVGNSGLIWSWKVAVKLFDPAGAPDGRVEADSCLYDRTTRRGYCPAAVMLTRSNATVCGTGMYWSMTTQRMQILSNAVVQLQQHLRFPAAGSGATNEPARSLPLAAHDQKTSAGGLKK